VAAAPPWLRCWAHAQFHVLRPPRLIGVLRETRRRDEADNHYRSGAKGIRTPDPLPAEQVLYQLSYSPENARTVYPKRHPGPNLIRRPMVARPPLSAKLGADAAAYVSDLARHGAELYEATRSAGDGHTM
jgi:hypothetical protein